MAHFYKATREGVSPSREKFKVIVIGIGKTIIPFREGQLEAKVMDRHEYKKSNKEGHLITIVVTNSDKQTLKAIFDKNKSNFDKENPEGIIDYLKEAGFVFEPETNIDAYLKNVLLEKAQSIEVWDSTIEIIKSRILGFQGWIKIYKDQYENKFDEAGSISEKLDELQNKMAEFEPNEKNLDDLNGAIGSFNKIIVDFSVEYLSVMRYVLEKLQPKFIDVDAEQTRIDKAIAEISSILKKYENKKSTEETARFLSDKEEGFYAVVKSVEKNIDDLEEKVEGISKQLSALDSLPFHPQLKEALRTEELTNLIDIFVEGLETESLVTLREYAAHIETVFNANRELIKNDFEIAANDFVVQSKEVLQDINEKLDLYSELEFPRQILEQVTSLQSELDSLSINDFVQFCSIQERVGTCSSKAAEFCARVVEEEGAEKTNLRPISYKLTKFFKEEGVVIGRLKQHGEEIWFWRGSVEKSQIIKEISDRADSIKAKNEELLRDIGVDKEKVAKVYQEYQGLKDFIAANEKTLSRYRGISLFGRRPATCFGGGRVKSMEYVNEIKAGLEKLNENASRLSLISAN